MTESDITAIRDALAAGPKPGEWAHGNTDPLLFGVSHGWGTEPIGFVYGPSRAEASAYGRECLATAAYIAACHPERIARLLDALDQAQRREEVLRHERDRARARNEWSVQVLAGIHALLYPAPVKTEDGRTMVFRPSDPNPHEVLQALSDRIRAIPDEIAAMQKDAP